MDRALLRHTLGMPVYNEREKPSEEERAQIQKEEEELIEVEENDFREEVKKVLVKLLLSPGWIKGYIANITKELDIDPNAELGPQIIKEEVEMGMREMIDEFKAKYEL